MKFYNRVWVLCNLLVLIYLFGLLLALAWTPNRIATCGVNLEQLLQLLFLYREALLQEIPIKNTGIIPRANITGKGVGGSSMSSSSVRYLGHETFDGTPLF